MTHRWSRRDKCPRCEKSLEGVEVISTTQVNCETTRFILLGGHTVIHEGLRRKIKCNPIETLTIPDWVPAGAFAVDFAREVGRIDVSVRNSRERYRVYALSRTFCQPTNGRIKVAREYKGVEIVDLLSTYCGPGRTKLGEVIL